MPAKPVWYGRLDEIVAAVRALPQQWIDRQMVEELLGVGPRRAQQILQSCLAGHVGNSSVATQESFLAHLEHLASGKDGLHQQRRRRRFAQTLAQWRKQRLDQPQVLLESLPQGVALSPGMVSVRFTSCQEALEKLRALAMAIGRDFDEFEKLTTTAPVGRQNKC